MAETFVPEIDQVVTGRSIRKDRDITGRLIHVFTRGGHVVSYLIEVAPNYRDMVDADSVRLAHPDAVVMAQVRAIAANDELDDETAIAELGQLLRVHLYDVRKSRVWREDDPQPEDRPIVVDGRGRQWRPSSTTADYEMYRKQLDDTWASGHVVSEWAGIFDTTTSLTEVIS